MFVAMESAGKFIAKRLLDMGIPIRKKKEEKYRTHIPKNFFGFMVCIGRGGGL